jgi:hypothetical protein
MAPGVLYGSLIVGSMATLCRRLGCVVEPWAVPVALFAMSHRTAIMASSFSDADLAQAACLFAAIAFAVPRGEAETSRDVRVDSAYDARRARSRVRAGAASGTMFRVTDLKSPTGDGLSLPGERVQRPLARARRALA